MKKLLFWLGMMIGFILAVALSDKQTPAGALKQQPVAKLGEKPFFGRWGIGKATMPLPDDDWIVRMHVTDLNEAEARDYAGMFAERYADELDGGIGFVTLWKGEWNEGL